MDALSATSKLQIISAPELSRASELDLQQASTSCSFATITFVNSKPMPRLAPVINIVVIARPPFVLYENSVANFNAIERECQLL
jgi:hypothetical protein